MLKNLLDRWSLRLFLKRISWFAIIISGVLLIALTGLSVYGNNVGNFVVSVDNDISISLSLSETGEFGKIDSTSVLATKGIKGITDTTYKFIPKDIDEGSGLKSDTENSRYFAYTFYLKNTSEIAIGYSATLNINKATRGIEKAIRIMLITDATGERTSEIFAAAKADGTAEVLTADDAWVPEGEEVKDDVLDSQYDYVEPYTTTPWSGSRVAKLDVDSIEKDEIHKFTVVMWIEGWDEDCVDAIIDGTFEISMTFTSYLG